jgi:hypothetical protein
MRNIVYVILGLLVVALPLSSYAKNDNGASKCLSETVKSFNGVFLPSHDKQKLVVTRRQFVSSELYGKTSLKETICQYNIFVAKFQAISKHYIPATLWTYEGPGLIFTDGLWHAQETRKILDVEPVHLFGPLQQILVYSQDTRADGGSGELQIFALTSPFGNYRTLMDVVDHGGLKYRVENGVIDVIGTYYGPTDCLACGHPREVKLSYDPQVQQLAIVNPDKNSAEFFKQIEKH